MSENEKKFHDFALKSILFKGRGDWYFCFLKSEKLAQVLSLLATDGADRLAEISSSAADLPHTIVHFVAGEVDLSALLADIFSILSSIRLSGASGSINAQNTAVLLEEYERIAEKFGEGSRLSPFISAGDIAIPQYANTMPFLSAGSGTDQQKSIKDNKGHFKGHSLETSKGHHINTGRISAIFDFVKKNNGVSIKDIARVVKGCSEKTIQRELITLIRQRAVRKEGERRWSIYLPT